MPCCIRTSLITEVLLPKFFDSMLLSCHHHQLNRSLPAPVPLAWSTPTMRSTCGRSAERDRGKHYFTLSDSAPHMEGFPTASSIIHRHDVVLSLQCLTVVNSQPTSMCASPTTVISTGPSNRLCRLVGSIPDPCVPDRKPPDPLLLNSECHRVELFRSAAPWLRSAIAVHYCPASIRQI